MRCWFFILLLLPGLAFAKGGAPTVPPDKPRFDCFVGGGKVFADRQLTGPTTLCSSLSEEAGWQEVLFNSLMSVSYQTASLRKDGNSLDVMLHFRLSDPISGSDGSFTYDAVRASYRFDCLARTQAMSKAVYSLIPQGTREQDTAPAEPVRPGSASEAILDKLCLGIDRHEADEAKYAADDDAEFVCPEYVADVEGKKADLVKFLARASARNPKVTVADIGRIRWENLVLHRCQKTLNYMAAHSAPSTPSQ